MTKIMKVDTIHCGGCEKRVTRALMGVAGVNNVIASHETSCAYIKLDEEVSNEALTQAIIDEGGFTVVSID